MVITIFFPEFIMAHAFFELILAVQATELVRKCVHRKVAKYPWLIRVLVHESRARSSPGEQWDRNIEDQHSNQQEWTLIHSYFANIGGLYYDGESTRFPLTTSQYAQESHLYSLPKVEKEDIIDKAKQDFFAKGLAILQISQLVLSLIVRTTRRLPFSQLETLTLGLATCGVGTYATY